ncbi:hypothetical protein SAMN05421856_102433 [Chryseobacterium taichungense]|uniref:Uncharacterized protein n=1 Tax=Chryseobacterium taichungense TaxID=295069 RepID=A0A1H7XIC3_9FLAO|nr:hypothetical protein [Chryseobacterium taichungense]SEM32958.1 hypothetical protein SAMN05421856_102433 [Chryseobacterium taichungense]
MTGNSFYNKLQNLLFPVDEHESDILPVSSCHYYNPSPFQKVMLDYLTWNGIDKKGNVTNKKAYPALTEIQENRTALRECGFANGMYIEKLIVSEFLEMKLNIPDLNPVMFANFYEEQYHNIKLAKFATLETQKSNKITKEYYDTTRGFLIEIQGYFEALDLRTRIECNFTETENWNNRFRVEEFITSFTKLSLNVNTFGKLSINYFINPHLRELVGESLGDAVEKHFAELANGEMKDFVKMVPLNRRYDKYFKEIQTIPNYKVTVTEQNSL